jgi:hypothetical protein
VGRAGGAVGVISRRTTGSARQYSYGCLVDNKRGRNVCANRLTLPIERVDMAVLARIGGDVLKPAIVDAVISGALEALQPRSQEETAERYRAELAAIERELGRLTEAIAAGGPVPALLGAVQTRQARRDELVAAITAANAAEHVRLDRRGIEKHVRAKIEAWRALLTSDIRDGRELLRQVLAGPVRFVPDDRRYRFEGEAAVGRLFRGIAGLSSLSTFVASLMPASWNQVASWLSRIEMLRRIG